MPIPSPIKIKRNGVEYISQVDRAKYLMVELERAALRDIGKLVRRRALDGIRKLQGLKKGRRPPNAFQFWVRKRETDLIVGIKHDTWYGVEQELGTMNQPRRAILTNSTMGEIQEIQNIIKHYLGEIEYENRVLGLINENEEGDMEDDSGA